MQKLTSMRAVANQDQGYTLDDLNHLWIDWVDMRQFRKEPLIFTKGNGIYLKDFRGKEYIDGISGVFVVNIGHGNRKVIGAMKEQLDQFSFNPPLHSTNPQAIQLSKRLYEIAHQQFPAAKFFLSGSEATEAAIKLSRQYQRATGNHGKYKILSKYLSYHGATLGALSATGLSDRKAPFEPLAEGFIHVHPPFSFHCPLGLSLPQCEVACAELVRETIRYESNSVAAVIMEPVSIFYGTQPPPRDYLKRIREICDETNTLLIFDEIITGFGRLGKMFGYEVYDAIPDIVCFAKGVSSGYAPLAGILVNKRIAEAIEDVGGFWHGQTYGGNPVSCAAGNSALEQLQTLNLVENSRIVGDHLLRLLKELSEFQEVVDVRGVGMLVGVELAQNGKKDKPFDEKNPLGKRVEKEALKRGLIIRAAPSWFDLAPPLISTKPDIDKIVSILRESFVAARV